MSGDGNKPRRRRRSFDLSYTTSEHTRQTNYYAANVEYVAQSCLSLHWTLSQASTLWPRRDQANSNDEPPLVSFTSHCLSGVIPAFPKQSPAQYDPTQSDDVKQSNAARRQSLSDNDTPLVRKSNFKKRVGEQFFPTTIDTGIEPGHIRRKKAGQRCASATRSELTRSRGHARIASPMEASSRQKFSRPHILGVRR